MLLALIACLGLIIWEAPSAYDETLAREIVNECAATARARASSEDALGAVREAVRGATKRANAR